MTLRSARVESWGRYPRNNAGAVALRWASDPLPPGTGPFLPHGLGRSYGDSCLVAGGTHLLTRGLDRLLAFDSNTGELTCEAGVTLDELFAFAVPRGWFLPVTPGTRYVTLGGAIANDVHGKNFHVQGSFGDHVTRIELLRTDGSRVTCGPEQDPEWFRATVGGLGLTGAIVRATVRLMRVSSATILAETIPFTTLGECFSLSNELAGRRYVVAWIDTLANHRAIGRGVLFVGDHAPAEVQLRAAAASPFTVPFDFPNRTLNGTTARAFNALYRWLHRRRRGPAPVAWMPFFHPLDRLDRWNRIYGRRGFVQWQVAVPPDGAHDILAELLSTISHARVSSFLGVLKLFGERRGPGLLSFPRPGASLALDFPMVPGVTLNLLDRLDAVAVPAGGALYPAKDARMSPATFRASFPRLAEFRAFRDPGLLSAFWERVEGDR